MQILSGRGFYIDALRHGKADFARAMEPVLANAAPAPEPIEEAVLEEAVEPVVDITPTIEAPSADAERLKDETDEVIDQELLAILLEEAVGVLESIAHSLEVSRGQPSNEAELTTIRRGFHTLKGSGRMVGLIRLGEAAWAVEQIMNLWQQEERTATPPLFELVEFAHGAFTRWVSCLQDGQPQPDPQPIVDRAHALRRGKAVQSEVVPPAPKARDALALATTLEGETATEDSVKIGGLAFSTSLFTVFANEARQHLETIERELAQAAAGRTTGVRDELVRRPYAGRHLRDRAVERHARPGRGSGRGLVAPQAPVGGDRTG